MHELDELQLKKAAGLAGFRTFIGNLQDFGVGDRLTNIKTAIPKVQAALLKGPAKVSGTPPESVALLPCDSGSLAALSITSASPSVACRWAVPLTLGASFDAVSKKRKIGEAPVVDKNGVEHGQDGVQQEP